MEAFTNCLAGPEEIVQLGKDNSKIKLIGMITHPGVDHFLVYCEYNFFTPRTHANEDFQVMLFLWEEFLWVIATIPVDRKEACDLAAFCTDMKLQKGSPAVLSHGVVKLFPMSGNHCYTLQHNSAELIYDGTLPSIEEQDRELEKVNEIFRAHGDPDIGTHSR